MKKVNIWELFVLIDGMRRLGGLFRHVLALVQMEVRYPHLRSEEEKRLTIRCLMH